MSTTWKDYFERTKNKPPRPLLVKALSFVVEKENALDLGAGALNDVAYLLREGFEHITAVDRIPVAKEIAKALPPERFDYVVESFESFTFPIEKYDLVNAQYSLPFTSPESFNHVFISIVSSLKKGGVFSGQLFGDKDEWRSDPNMTFHTRKDVERLLKELEVLVLNEEERDGATAAGDMKHWHVFDIIVRKS